LLNVADSSVVSVDGKLATGTAKDRAGSTVAAATNDYRPVRSAYKPYFFSLQVIFFSHNKSANSTFSHGLSAKRIRQIITMTWLTTLTHEQT